MPCRPSLRAVVLLLLTVAPPAIAAPAQLPESGRIELITWVPGKEEFKFAHVCILSGKSIHCEGSMRWGPTDTTTILDGLVDGGQLTMKYASTTHYTDPTCGAEYKVSSGMNLALDDGGAGSGTWTGGPGTWTKASAKCSMLVGKTESHGPEPSLVSWRVLEAALDQADFGDAQLRGALWTQLGQSEGPLARQCFNETVAKLNEARNAELKERIETAAYQQHIIERLAAAADADDFDPQWIEAAKGIGGAGGAGQRIADRLVKLLPGPFGTLVSMSQKAYRVSNGINDKAVLPKLKGKLYDAYKIERAARPNDSPVEVLKDASAGAGGWAKLKTDLIRDFPGANDAARERAMAEYLAARFDFIYRARETAANKERLLANAWAGAANDIARVRMTMLDCMAK
jgi:hypothetical protein